MEPEELRDAMETAVLGDDARKSACGEGGPEPKAVARLRNQLTRLLEDLPDGLSVLELKEALEGL